MLKVVNKMTDEFEGIVMLRVLRFLCRQMGLELFKLGDHLPLYDGLTGQKVSDAQDRKIEIVRDALMDAARSRVEELGVEAVSGQW